MARILIHNTRGKEDVERATLAFVVANAALTAGQEARAMLTVDGVWLATKGYADGLQAQGFVPLSEVMLGFMENGGRVWVCGACAKPREITPEQLIEGPEMVGAIAAVEALVEGAQTLSF